MDKICFYRLNMCVPSPVRLYTISAAMLSLVVLSTTMALSTTSQTSTFTTSSLPEEVRPARGDVQLIVALLCHRDKYRSELKRSCQYSQQYYEILTCISGVLLSYFVCAKSVWNINIIWEHGCRSWLQVLTSWANGCPCSRRHSIVLPVPFSPQIITFILYLTPWCSRLRIVWSIRLISLILLCSASKAATSVE